MFTDVFFTIYHCLVQKATFTFIVGLTPVYSHGYIQLINTC